MIHSLDSSYKRYALQLIARTFMASSLRRIGIEQARPAAAAAEGCGAYFIRSERPQLDHKESKIPLGIFPIPIPDISPTDTALLSTSLFALIAGSPERCWILPGPWLKVCETRPQRVRGLQPAQLADNCCACLPFPLVRGVHAVV